MAGTAPLITVVIVTHRGREHLDECLASLTAQDLPGGRWKAVVVDNASTDGTAELLQAPPDWLTVIRLAENAGFAGGNNVALGVLDTPYAFLLNDDAVLAPDTLSRLLAFVEAPARRRVGAVTATLLLAARFRDDPSGPVVDARGRRLSEAPSGDVVLVNSTGNTVRTDGFGVDRGWLERRAEHHPPEEVFGFCGAAALLRAEALHEVGLFDPDFFMYYEDTDLSWRLRRAGWVVAWCEDAVVQHRHAATSREGSAFFRFHNERNRLAMVIKNGSPGLVLRCVLRYPLSSLSWLLTELPDLSNSRQRLAVLVSIGRLLPRLVRRRWAIQRHAVLSRREVEALLSAVPVSATGSLRH